MEAAEQKNVASILAIATANPTNCFYQSEFPDFYFRVTNSDHMPHLKSKFQRICEKSGVHKRYFYLNEEVLRANPEICNYKARSLDARQKLVAEEIPKLGKEAALKAIQEWGQPISRITHLVFCTSSSNHMPGADFQLAKLLGLSSSTQRFMLYQLGCYSAGTILRLAKDVAENSSSDARILVVSVDTTTIFFQAPSEEHMDVLIGEAIFADGAAATIIGANADPVVEPPLFRILSASQSTIPDTEDGVRAHISEMGLLYYLSPNNPNYFGQSIKQCLGDAIPGRVSDYNSLFYVIHPGGRAILDEIEKNLGLKDHKLKASRRVLREYGNMGGPSALFALDLMRKMSMEEGKTTTGEGSEYGVLIGMGPGLTVETVFLQSLPMAVPQSLLQSDVA